MLGAIVLVGGASSRMGEDKARLAWNGLGAVERLARVAGGLGADVVITAGRGEFGFPRVDDLPNGNGGPVPGILAGLIELTARGCSRALVLAVDAPTVSEEDLRPLVEVAPPGAAYQGLHLPFFVHLPCAAPPVLKSVHDLITLARLARPPAPRGAAERLRGANTPPERARLLRALIRLEREQNSLDNG